MNTCYLTKDVMRIILLLIDDPITYQSFVLSCKWIAFEARKFIKIRQRELVGKFPPIFLKTIALNLNPKDCDGLLDLIIKSKKISADPIKEHKGGHIWPQGDILTFAFDQNGGVLELNGEKFVISGEACCSIFLISIPFVTVCASTCKIQSFYLDTIEREFLSQNIWFQKINDETLIIDNGCFGKIEFLPKFWTPKTTIKKTTVKNGVEKVYISSHINHDKVYAFYNLIAASNNNKITNLTKVNEFSFLMEGAATEAFFDFNFNGNVREFLNDLDFYFDNTMSVSIKELTNDITTNDEINKQRVKCARKCLPILRSLCDIGLIEQFE